MSGAARALQIPGFVDLQVNGHGGTDFSSADLTEESFAQACRAILATGTAVFLPTIITSSEDVYRRNLPLMASVMGDSEFHGRLPGFHIEGPFLSAEPGAIGAHNPHHVRPPDIGFFEKLQTWSQGRTLMITVAAGVPGVEELIRHASSAGICVALGHHMATSDDLSRAAEAGARVLTHLGNGIPNQLDRHHNPLIAGMANDDLHAMIITDGHHLPSELIKIILRSKGVARTVVTSDASPLSGLPPGRYDAFGIEAVMESDGRLHNPERQCLVGSSATLFECMNYLASLDLLTPQEMIDIAFRNPLNLIGLEEPDIPPGVRFDPDKNQFISSI